MLICFDKEVNGEFGYKGVRVNVVKLFYVVYKFGINKDFEIFVSYCFREVFYIFLEYFFIVLYWRIKFINFMTIVIEIEVVSRFIELFNVNKKFDVYEWVNFCIIVLGEVFVKYCSGKFG